MNPRSVLVRLAISMRAHERGGTLLVVPHQTDHWQNSIVRPITYSVIPPFSEIGTLLSGLDQADESSRDALKVAVDALAGLTAVDGATVISDRFDLLAFGGEDHDTGRGPQCRPGFADGAR